MTAVPPAGRMSPQADKAWGFVSEDNGNVLNSGSRTEIEILGPLEKDAFVLM